MLLNKLTLGAAAAVVTIGLSTGGAMAIGGGSQEGDPAHDLYTLETLATSVGGRWAETVGIEDEDEVDVDAARDAAESPDDAEQVDDD